MPWQLDVTDRAERDLTSLSPRDREAVRRILRRLPIDPSGVALRKLGGRPDQWRVRAGRYRIILQLDNDSGVMRVLRILPRDRAYRD